ncbi:MAG TPA: Co2+/Mg2+ efflux protein ApaG [Acidobacteria bacterium]|jgi:ApaG protein|nr:Co2+/Mg2+ efflux protein ApaG [Acidobacteriota bacterium]HIN70007.1 Co2+/Mg2+ efflux protein ApaG [Acidobacteriota bacterium]
MNESEAVTKGIRVHVTSHYSAEHSQPQNLWFFLYTIKISNESTDTVQLISRHWIITNAENQVEEVQGPGVIGKQPVLAPGESFEYTSGCPLTTPFGMMKGTYQMVTADGDNFEIEVASFALTEPYTVH